MSWLPADTTVGYSTCCAQCAQELPCQAPCVGVSSTDESVIRGPNRLHAFIGGVLVGILTAWAVVARALR